MFGYNPAAAPAGYPQGQPLFGGTGGFGGAPAGAPPPAAFGSAAPASFGGNPGGGFSAAAAAFGPKPGQMAGAPQGPLFGGGQKVGFGGTAGGYGAGGNPGGFGAPPQGGFGGGSFGPSAPASGGLFGKPGGGFGGGATIGAPGAFGAAPAGGFGASATPSYGAPTPFGAPTTGGFGGGGFPAQGTPGFGAPTPATFGGASGAFGAQPAASYSTNPGGFGATGPTPGGFGASGTPGFGGSAAPGGLFGAGGTTFGAVPTPAFGGANPGFGATATPTFGAGAQNPSMMPASTAPPGAGTMQVKHMAQQLHENGQVFQMMHLTGMQAYMNKSTEELRFEDYQYNGVRQKMASGGMGGVMGGAMGGTMGAAPTAGGMFGATAAAPGTNSFFQSANPQGGAPTQNLFGAPTSAPASGGLFGAAAGGMFGAGDAKPGFGSAQPTAFGAQPGGAGLFGSTQQQQKPGLFGTMTTPGAGTSLFGSGAPTTAPTTSGLFGAPTNAPQGTQGLFGGATSLAPPQTSATGQPGTGLFSNPGTTSTGLFGAPTSNPSSMFGSMGGMGMGGMSGMGGIPQSSPSLYGQQAGGLMASAPPAGQNQGYMDSSMLSAFKDPYGMGWLFPQGMPEDVLTLQRRNSDKAVALEPTSALERALKHGKSSVRKASYGPDSWAPQRKSLTPRRPPTTLFSPMSAVRNDPGMFSSRRAFSNLRFEPYPEVESETYRMRGSPQVTTVTDFGTVELRVVGLNEDMVKLLVKISRQSTVRELKERICGTVAGVEREQIQLVYRGSRLRDSDYIRDLHLSSGDEVYFLVEPEPRSMQKALAPKELLPKLSLPGYTTTPSIVELARMSAEELAAVRSFSVQNEYGRIEFLGETDVRALDIDAIVRIEEKAVIMYPDEKGAPKPSIGKGLNKPARIRLFDCRPRKEIPPELFEDKIRKVCARNGTEFESYDTDSGEWVFRANHF